MKEKREGYRNKKSIKIVIILSIALIFLFSREEFREKAANLISSVGRVEKTFKVEKTIPYDFEGDSVKAYGDTIVNWDGEKILAVNTNGEEMWRKNVTFENPIVLLGGNYIYMCESTTGDLYYLDFEGRLLHRYEANDVITGIVESGQNLILLFNGVENEKINIIDGSGKLTANTLIEGKRVTSCCVNEEGSTFSTATMGLDGDEITSELILYNISGQKIGSLIFKDQIIIFSKFVSSNKLVALTEKGLYFIKDESILWQKDIERIKDICIDTVEDRIYLLYGDTMESISFNGKTDKKISLTDEYNKIVRFQDNILVVGDENILGFNNGEEMLKYKSEEEIKKVLTNEKNIVMFTEGKIKTMSMTNKK